MEHVSWIYEGNSELLILDTYQTPTHRSSSEYHIFGIMVNILHHFSLGMARQGSVDASNSHFNNGTK